MKDLTPAELALIALALWQGRGPGRKMDSPVEFFDEALDLWSAARVYMEDLVIQ